MSETFVCLANSKKFGERCIAGVEIVDFDGTNYSIVRRESQPKWLRPISSSSHGAVSASLVGKVGLLDVVEVNILSERPQEYQSENVLFDERSLKVIGRLDWDSSTVAQFQHSGLTQLFGNHERAVHVHAIGQVNYSLTLISPTSVRFNSVTYPNGNSQLRSTFLFGGVRYDLPITDVAFCNKYYKNPRDFSKCSEIFFTISLGVKFNDFHYKLIAAVFHF